MLVRSSAQLRYVSIPPRKMRLVADTVKGLPVEKALAILNFTPRIAARHLAKTVKSAAANALSKEGTDHLSPEALVISNIIVDAAPMAKRIRFRSMGRVFRYRKRFCHVRVELEGKAEVAADKKARAATSTSAAKKTGTAGGAKAKPTKKKTGAKKPAVKSKTARSTKKTGAKKTTSGKTGAKAKAKTTAAGATKKIDSDK